MKGLAVAAVLLVSLAPASPSAAGEVQAFVGAELIPIVGEPIPEGVLVVEGTTISAIGAAGDVEVPPGATVHDVSGKVIMPGLVDTHSHIGGAFAGDGSAPIQPAVRNLDSINVRDAGFQRARSGGLTTLNVMPGSGHLMSGQTTYLKMRQAETIDDALILTSQGLTGGMKMANGTNSRRDKPPFPGTRAKSAALVREQFVKAQGHKEKLERAGDDPEKRPDRDLAMEALVEILDGQRMVHHHTHRHDDILTVLRLKEEFGFNVVLHHVSEAWKVADEIASAGAPCSIIVVDSPGGKLEARDVAFKTGGILERAGVTVGFHTDDWITDSRLFLRSAGLAVRAGMSRAGALKGLTLAGAIMMELDHRIGSLEPGKDADLIVLSGDPLSVYTKVEQTWVEGDKVFDLADEGDRLLAVGGYGAGNPRQEEITCFDHEEVGR